MTDSAETKIALVVQAITQIERDIAGLDDRQKAFVLGMVFDAHVQAVDARFKPLEKLVYGVVALIVIAVISALVAVVVVAPKLGQA